MVSISLCMIVKNEEDVLRRCLSCVRDLVDEIIIVDTGSTDTTREIAAKYTDKIYSFLWTDDFSAARNYAFSKATMEYCMWLDADDVITEDNQRLFLALKQALTIDIDIVMMRYNTAFDANGTPSFWYFRERVIRNNSKYLWEGAVHEVITPIGNVVYSDIAVSHQKLHVGDPDRNLNVYKKLILQGKVLSAREHYYYARELYYHRLYEIALKELQKFLTFKDAWVENKIEACLLIAHCCTETGRYPAALEALFKSFEYDTPRAEICCEIGNYFISLQQYQIAAFWYKTALNCDISLRKNGFIQPDSYNFTPFIQLCVCYDKLGKYETAQKYNDLAGSYKPESPSYLYNKKYFDAMNLKV